MTMPNLAPAVFDPPKGAQLIHGSGGTRFYGTPERGFAPDYLPIDEDGALTIVNLWDLAVATPNYLRTTDVHGTEARGLPIFTNGTLGADLLYVPPGKSFPLHEHPGHHLLLCVGGRGTITFGEQVKEVRQGDLYMIEATVPHAVGSHEEGPGHWLISFGAPHTRVDSDKRMTVLEEDGTHNH